MLEVTFKKLLFGNLYRVALNVKEHLKIKRETKMFAWKPVNFNSIKFCLECCHVLGVKEVSIYAFSLENFKREKEEVDYLMELTKTNLL